MKIVCTVEEVVCLIRNCECNKMDNNCRGCVLFPMCRGNNIEEVAEIEIARGDENG